LNLIRYSGGHEHESDQGSARGRRAGGRRNVAAAMKKCEIHGIVNAETAAS
jgi:hypothetical protein